MSWSSQKKKKAFFELFILSEKKFYNIFCKSQCICTSDHIFKRTIWNKFTEIKKISKFQKMNKVNFPQIS